MVEAEKNWIETNNAVCALLRQAHDVLAMSSFPPKRTWVGLTDEDIWDVFGGRIGTSNSDVNPIRLLADARKIEAKLKDKNSA